MLTGIFGEGEDGSNATGGWFSGCEGILKGEFREHTILSVTLIVFFFLENSCSFLLFLEHDNHLLLSRPRLLLSVGAKFDTILEIQKKTY